MDYCLIFGGEPDKKLQELYEKLDLSIDFELFKKLYHNATQQKFNFLYVDVRNEAYRRNFTHRYMLPPK